MPDSTRALMPERPDATRVVADVRKGDADGITELYKIVRSATRRSLRHLDPSEVTDVAHDVFVTVWKHVVEGRVRSAQAIYTYSMTVAYRTSAMRFRTAAKEEARNRKAPAQQASLNTDRAIDLRRLTPRALDLLGILGLLSDRDREILARFYLREESRELICMRMGLSANQFRNAKTRATQKIQRAVATDARLRAIRSLAMRA